MAVQCYDFMVVNNPGKAKGPDALLRSNSLRQTDLGEEYDSLRAIVENCMPAASGEIEEATYSDAERSQV